MRARDKARIEVMARAAADALVGAAVDWEGLPPEARRVFLAVALAVHQADRIEPHPGGVASPQATNRETS